MACVVGDALAYGICPGSQEVDFGVEIQIQRSVFRGCLDRNRYNFFSLGLTLYEAGLIDFNHIVAGHFRTV